MSAIKVFVPVIALVGLSAAFAQPPASAPKPAGTGLDEVLAKALAHSPDIQIAEAKLREAEAEVRRARLNLMQKVIDTQATIEAQKRQVGIAEAGLSRIAKLVSTGSISREELQVQEKLLLDAKSGLARCEASLIALIGAVPERFGKLVESKEALAISRLVAEDGIDPGLKPPHPAMADKIRAALDARLKSADFKGTTLGDAIEFLGSMSAQVPFVLSIGDKRAESVTLKIFGDVPLGAHLQALQDLAPGLQIFVRDYGLFFTFDNAPELGMSVADFWHGGKAKSAPGKR